MDDTPAGHSGQGQQDNEHGHGDGPQKMTQGMLAAGSKGQLKVLKPSQKQGGATTNDAHANLGANQHSGNTMVRKRRLTEHGAVYGPPIISAAAPDSAGESAVRPHKKNFRYWTPVLTDGFHQPVESRFVCFMNTEQLHGAMGTTDEDMRLLS